MRIAYYNRSFMPEERVKLPFTDRGFQFGDGAFAVIQVNQGVPLFFEHHLKQLEKQCTQFNLILPPLEPHIIEQLIHHNQATEGIWRLKIIITGGDSSEYRLPQRKGRILAFMKPFTPAPFKRLKMGSFSVPYSSCHAAFKSLAHLNRFYVMEEAHRLGLDDSLTTTESGILLEAAFGNIFWVKERNFFTSHPALPIYFGVTVNRVIDLAQDLDFNIEYVKWTLNDIPKGCIAFRTNTMHGIRPIGQMGSILFAENEALQSLFLNGYTEIVREEKRRYAKRHVPCGVH